MSLTERIFRAAEQAFRRPDVYKAWPLITERWEHAFWSWNDRYGPLTAEQRDYAAQLVVWALEFAADGEDSSHRYARLQHRLSFYLNHENVDERFEAIGGAREDAAQVDLDIFDPVPV